MLRPAGPADLLAVAALDRADFGDEAYPYAFFRQALDLWPSLFLVEVEAGAVAGYVLGAPAEKGCEVWILATVVGPAHRGKGIGEGLVRAIFERAKRPEVWLTVAPDNTPARHLYEKLGFRTLREEAEYFGPGEPRLVMMRPLDPYD